MRIGIIGAMNEEISSILSDVQNPVKEKIGVRFYYSGVLYGKEVTAAVSGWGKAAAASTCTTMIVRWGVEAIIFVGVAGAAAEELNVGDIVIADELVQHDLDARPIFPKYQVPILGVSHFETDKKLREGAILAAGKFLSSDIAEHIQADDLALFGITKPAVHHGLVASGDQFISDAAVLGRLRGDLGDLKCVEMEGASVAQICYEHNVPLMVMRTISDKADSSAGESFSLFISKIACHYSRGFIRNLMVEISPS
ncbi:MAG: 5'-methylthioadenosine/adenosylhomocysteine nucleosidase [Phycisphaerae bacterium]